jgi:hypothetical protein
MTLTCDGQVWQVHILPAMPPNLSRGAFLDCRLAAPRPAKQNTKWLNLLVTNASWFTSSVTVTIAMWGESARHGSGAVKNHLDRLVEAKLARLKVARGHLYWGITDEGRRHATERGLIQDAAPAPTL